MLNLDYKYDNPTALATCHSQNNLLHMGKAIISSHVETMLCLKNQIYCNEKWPKKIVCVYKACDKSKKEVRKETRCELFVV